MRIHYVEHVIRAGDADFRRAYAIDSRSHLESASAQYDLAARCLGPVEESLAASEREEVPCFTALTSKRDDGLSRGADLLEPYLPADLLEDLPADEILGGASRLYFCVPPNDKLNELRAQVAERLLNLRSCKDITGVRRALSLYGRRIDPALLVRATAEGLDLDVLLGRLSSARPTMYFQALWQRALQACERLRSLEDAELGAIERADSEAYAQLQNEQEIQVLEDGLELASQRLDDARKMKEAVDRSMESAEIRYNYYSSRKKINPQEAAEGKNLVTAKDADGRAATSSRSASDWAWVPTAEFYFDAGVDTGEPYAKGGVSLRNRLGGETMVQVYRDNAEGRRNDAAEARTDAALIGRQGGFERRYDDWMHQKDLALEDKQKLQHDLAGAEIRISIAELEVDLQNQRIENARSLRTFMREKTTSQTFHAARADRLRPLRYQQFRIA